jgi:hypothetical protein
LSLAGAATIVVASVALVELLHSAVDPVLLDLFVTIPCILAGIAAITLAFFAFKSARRLQQHRPVSLIGYLVILSVIEFVTFPLTAYTIIYSINGTWVYDAPDLNFQTAVFACAACSAASAVLLTTHILLYRAHKSLTPASTTPPLCGYPSPPYDSRPRKTKT